jgi:hypothetical protein
MPIEIVNDNDILTTAFDLIEQALKEGYQFNDAQKDLGIRISLDALAPTERPWFFEVAAMLRLPLWQALWGQWRRNQENGMAQAPVLDPSWREVAPDAQRYGLEDKTCPVCKQSFTPKQQGQIFCSPACAVSVELAVRKAARESGRAPAPRQTSDANKLTNWFVPPPIVDESDSVDLGEDRVETEA